MAGESIGVLSKIFSLIVTLYCITLWLTAWLGMVRHGPTRIGRVWLCEAGPGKAMLGKARRGWAWFGKDGTRRGF